MKIFGIFNIYLNLTILTSMYSFIFARRLDTERWIARIMCDICSSPDTRNWPTKLEICNKILPWWETDFLIIISWVNKYFLEIEYLQICSQEEYCIVFQQENCCSFQISCLCSRYISPVVKVTVALLCTVNSMQVRNTFYSSHQLDSITVSWILS